MKIRSDVNDKALVIGYGNTLRCDDAAGRAVARAVAEAASCGVKVLECHQLLPEVAERLAEADLVVFVDAEIGPLPGSVMVTRVLGLIAATRETALGHHVTPAALLALSAQLYGRAPDAFLVTIAAGSLELGDTLSEPVAAALPLAAATVWGILRGGTHGGPLDER